MKEVPERSAGWSRTGKGPAMARRIAVAALIGLVAVRGLDGCSRGPSDLSDSTGSMSSPSGSSPHLAITPRRAALTLGQQISLIATTSDPVGVRWSISPNSGSLDAQTSRDGQTIHFTAPNTPGVYTVKATGIRDPSQSSSVVIGVTDLPGVYTYHNDLGRTGQNTSEKSLTPDTVSPSRFGKLFSHEVDHFPTEVVLHRVERRFLHKGRLN